MCVVKPTNPKRAKNKRCKRFLGCNLYIYYVGVCTLDAQSPRFFFARGNNWVNGFRLWLVWQCLSNWLGYIQLMDIMDVIDSLQICLWPIANIVRLKQGLKVFTTDWREIDAWELKGYSPLILISFK